ncbi:MAG: Crp/Fnr family transcriptional regulator [Chitinophagaceae bacterium]
MSYFAPKQAMVSEPILKNISKHIALDVDEISHFLSLLKCKRVSRKTVLLREAQPCKYLYYVQQGALRAYHIDKHGKESTIMFAVDDWWITDMYCFLNNKPSLMYIETIKESIIYQLSKDNFDKLFAHTPKFERFFRILMQNAYTREQLRVIDNLSLTAKERYNKFLKKYPHIAEVVTQKQIASYLGVTPEFLSAIRKEP